MANAGNLAGLAALGALGLMMNRKQDGSKVPVEDRSTYPAGMGPTAPTPPIDDESSGEHKLLVNASMQPQLILMTRVNGVPLGLVKLAIKSL